ncbi:MAG: FecR domain-containing protein [Planctomycetes bacterium]|nr:FecR domain-containing protein [Planctomycetota bacterium]
MKKIIICLLLLLPQVLMAAQNFKVVDVDGDVFASIKFKKEPVIKGMDIAAGTRIRMPEGAYLLLNTPMNDEIEFSGKSYLKLEKLSESPSGETKCSLSLFQGIARNKVHKLKGKSSFTIKTPVAVAGVRGTEFQVSVSETGETEIAVLEGEVGVQDADGTGAAVSVQMGRSAKVKASGKITVKTVQNIRKQAAKARAQASKKAAESAAASGATSDSTESAEDDEAEDDESDYDPFDGEDPTEDLPDIIIDEIEDAQEDEVDIEFDLETIER